MQLNFSGPWVPQATDYLENYVWPVLLGLGILFCFISFLVLTCALHSSSESFLIGLAISSMLCLVCEGAKRIETFIGYQEAYQYAKGYMVAAHDWFWFTSIWIVLVMSLERVLGQCQRRPSGGLGLCRPLQAGIATVVLYCLCFVSALPQFWEWEVKHVPDKNDETVLKSVKSELSENYYYRTIYFWYKETITTFAPIPLCLLLVVLLCCSPDPDEDKPEDAHHTLVLDQRTGSMIPRPRPKMTGPGLYISQILCYLLLAGPWTLFTLAPHLKSHLYPSTEFFDLLEEVLEAWFHLFFLFQFFILLVHCPPFRRACCCRSPGCCSCAEERRDDV